MNLASPRLTAPRKKTPSQSSAINSANARAGEALPNVRFVVVLARGRVHEFVIQFHRNVKEFVHPAVCEFQLEGSPIICFRVVSRSEERRVGKECRSRWS